VNRDPSPSAPAEEAFDAIVIGAGSGGLTVVAGLLGLGRRVALVEAGDVGGDCTNTGCIPSKTLLEAAQRLRASGLAPGSPGWAAAAAGVLAEVRRRRDELREHETATLEAAPRLTLLRGHGRLVAAGRVDVELPGGPRRLRAPTVVLAPGAKAVVLDLPGLPPERTLTNATLFDLQRPPAHLAVLGGGAIGAEMATAFARLGSRVTLIEALPRILPAAEPDAAALVTAALRAQGVEVRTGCRAVAFDAAGGKLTLAGGATGDGDGAIDGVDRVLMAVGRRPALDGLAADPGGLEALGIRVGRLGIVTDRSHRTGLAGVYAIGDATERAKFTHAANAQGRRLVRHLAVPWLPLAAEGDYPSVTFTDPEVAQIGPPLARLQRRIHPDAIVSHRVELADLDRGYVTGLRQGFVVLHARRLSGRLLSATVVGPHAGELIQLLTWTQRRGGSLWQLSRHVVAYPALAEGIKRAADAFVFATLPALPRELRAYLRLRWRRPRGAAPATAPAAAPTATAPGAAPATTAPATTAPATDPDAAAR
jgi:dihydrolipoamide dehydrogenase